MRGSVSAAVVVAGVLGLAAGPGAIAGPEPNRVAIFSGLDKITGVITTFEVEIDKTKRFGTLNVRPRVCNTRPVTEQPRTMAFVEVDENQVDGKLKRIFTGWMLAQSPGLNAVEHPVYDVWLSGCRQPLAGKKEGAGAQSGTAAAGEGTARPQN